MTHFDHLGRALRWLRDERGLRQYHVAEAAAITKAMLSSYETSKQKPSLETLGKLLDALECDLYSLAGALEVFDGDSPAEGRRRLAAHRARRAAFRPSTGSSETTEATTSSNPSMPEIDVRQLLDLDGPLPEGQEEALRDVLGGFHRLMRHLYDKGGDD